MLRLCSQECFCFELVQKFCLGRTVLNLECECLCWGGCIGGQQSQEIFTMLRPPLSLRIHGSWAFGVGKPGQCMDRPGSQAANEVTSHLAQRERRGHLTAAYGVLSRPCCPRAQPPAIVSGLRGTHIHSLKVFGPTWWKEYGALESDMGLNPHNAPS